MTEQVGHTVVEGCYCDQVITYTSALTGLSYLLTLHYILLTAFSPPVNISVNIHQSPPPKIPHTQAQTSQESQPSDYTLTNFKTINHIFGSNTVKKVGHARPEIQRQCVLWLMITPKSIRDTRLGLHTWSLNNLSVNCLPVPLKNNPRLFLRATEGQRLCNLRCVYVHVFCSLCWCILYSFIYIFLFYQLLKVAQLLKREIPPHCEFSRTAVGVWMSGSDT